MTDQKYSDAYLRDLVAALDESPNPMTDPKTPMRFKVLAHDVASLPNAPDLEFDFISDNSLACHLAWEKDGARHRLRCSCQRLNDERSRISIYVDDVTYVRVDYLHDGDGVPWAESLTEEVSHFAAGIIWSAWRRYQLPNPATPGDRP